MKDPVVVFKEKKTNFIPREFEILLNKPFSLFKNVLIFEKIVMDCLMTEIPSEECIFR